MIEVKDLKKGFDGIPVINGVSAIFQTGKCNLIIGSSGSGKTVLMKCLVGLFEPDSGDISYGGKDFTSMNEEDRKMLRQQIGMLFQGSALFDSMTVEQNIMFPLDMFTNDSFTKKLDRVNEVLERVNLKEVNSKFPAEISEVRSCSSYLPVFLPVLNPLPRSLLQRTLAFQMHPDY